MITLQGVADALAGAVTRTGPWAPAILFVASLVEYVFPPFPGDLLVVLGAWYAVEGAISWPATFVSVTAGAVVGSWIDYRIGVVLGRRIDRRATARGSLSAERLARFEAGYRRWGSALLVANRFFPGVRAFVFVAAGASGIPLRKVLLFGGLSAALWNALLLAAGGLLAHNAGELVLLFERYTRAAWLVLAAVAVVGLLVFAVRRRASAARIGGQR